MGFARRPQVLLVVLASAALLAWGAFHAFYTLGIPDVSGRPWLAAPAGDTPDPAIAGRWVQTGQWVDGRPVAGASIDGQSFTLTHPGENLAQIVEVRCRIVAADADADPRWLDVVIESTSPRESFWHSHIGKSMGMVYQIQGDQLLLNTSVPGSDDRPSGLEPGRNTWMFLEMRRGSSGETTRPDPQSVVTVSDEVALASDLLGEWNYIDELVLTFYPDTLIFTAGPEGPIIIELEVLDWDTGANPARIDAVMIKHPEPQQLGQRVRMIYEKLSSDRQRVAMYLAESPGYGSWPTGFTGQAGKALVVGEWELIKP